MFVYYSTSPWDAIIFTDWSPAIDFIKGPGPLNHDKINWRNHDPSDCCWLVPGTWEDK